MDLSVTLYSCKFNKIPYTVHGAQINQNKGAVICAPRAKQGIVPKYFSTIETLSLKKTNSAGSIKMGLQYFVFLIKE